MALTAPESVTCERPNPRVHLLLQAAAADGRFVGRQLDHAFAATMSALIWSAVIA